MNVNASGTTLSTDPDSNASATVIKGKDLEALSDDPDELSSELTALAGPSAGPNGGQIYVDGFTGGQLPPKSSIREIRINQNPFSAQYDRVGYGRVEVFTKPGTDKFHGFFQVNGNANFLNTSNPFLGTTPELPYHTIFILGSLTGPISSKASFSLGGSHRIIQDNLIFDGTLLVDAPGSTTLLPVRNHSCPFAMHPRAYVDPRALSADSHRLHSAHRLPARPQEHLYRALSVRDQLGSRTTALAVSTCPQPDTTSIRPRTRCRSPTVRSSATA